MVDEYMTSQTCSQCHQAKMKFNARTRVGTCQGGGVCGPMDRDINGARNIKAVLESLAKTGTKPELMTRRAAEEEDADDL